MFLNHYGLREQPFGVTPDPRYLYFGEVHREALASLVYGIEAGLGFASLIAEPGTGKTTLLYYLLARYRATARTAFIFESQCTSQELLRNLLLEFEIGDPASDTVCALNKLKEFLAQQARARKRVILMLDEAQNFDDSVLETVRLLSNFETAGSKLLHIIVCGQPSLAEKLSLPKLLNVRQRISIATRLRPFAPVDVMRYVAHRLSIAGYRGPALFTPAALDAIARLSGGVPREINRLCFGALSLGCALERRMIDADLVREVATDLDFSALLNAEPTRKMLDIPPSDELGREFAEALARAQSAASAAARETPKPATPAVAAPQPPTPAMAPSQPAIAPSQPAIAAPNPAMAAPQPAAMAASQPKTDSRVRPAAAKDRPYRRIERPVARPATGAYTPAERIPLQSWIASDKRRSSRLKSTFSTFAVVAFALLALAMGTQFLASSPAQPPAVPATSAAPADKPVSPVHTQPRQRQAAERHSSRASTPSSPRTQP